MPKKNKILEDTLEKYFLLVKKKFTSLCVVMSENFCNIQGNSFSVEILKDKSIILKNVIRSNNLKDAYRKAVDKIKNEENKRKEDISALEKEVQHLRAQLEKEIGNEEEVANELGQKILLISQHHRNIKQIRMKKEIQITYEERCKQRVIELEPCIATYVPWLNITIVWCPILMKQDTKEIDKVKEINQIKKITTKKLFTYSDHPIDITHIDENDGAIIQLLLKKKMSLQYISQKLRYSTSDIQAYIMHQTKKEFNSDKSKFICSICHQASKKRRKISGKRSHNQGKLCFWAR